MLILIHGDDIVSSRKALREEKSRLEGSEVVTLDGRKIVLSDIIIATQSVSLFASGKTTIVEDLLKGGINKQKEIILSYLTKSGDLSDVILWEGFEVEKTKINKFFPKAKIIHFPLPKLLFQFLDLLGAKPPSLLIPMFWQLLKQKEAEFIFVMILRQLRFLIIAKDMGQRGLRDLSPWQARKFTNQSRFFSFEELTLAYRSLLTLEYKIKTGRTPYSFSKALDIFLATL